MFKGIDGWMGLGAGLRRWRTKHDARKKKIKLQYIGKQVKRGSPATICNSKELDIKQCSVVRYAKSLPAE